jgi:hypothetical protein
MQPSLLESKTKSINQDLGAPQAPPPPSGGARKSARQLLFSYISSARPPGIKTLAKLAAQAKWAENQGGFYIAQGYGLGTGGANWDRKYNPQGLMGLASPMGGAGHRAVLRRTTVASSR